MTYGLTELPPGWAVAFALVLGLVVGSFLNVVILRLPRMMELAWEREARAVLGQPGEKDAPQARYDLWRPGSHCPHCGRGVRPLENIPLLGFLWLRARCPGCGGRISWQYPAVELLTGLLFALVVWHFGPGLDAVFALAFTAILMAAAGIDARTQLLPDSLTLPLLWLGLLANLGEQFAALDAAVLGAVAGYLSLWLVYHAFRLLTGKEGMGHGDFKLLAALGAWMGWQALPFVLLLASLAGAAVGITLILLRGRDRNLPIPFGPYLAGAGFLALLWGDASMRWYLG
jgi:leader peptidase (prepilin peptidase) / N-methyltransferase